jgi:hypothetical protein
LRLLNTLNSSFDLSTDPGLGLVEHDVGINHELSIRVATGVEKSGKEEDDVNVPDLLRSPPHHSALSDRKISLSPEQGAELALGAVVLGRGGGIEIGLGVWGLAGLRCGVGRHSG